MIEPLKQRWSYYLWATYRRRRIDRFLEERLEVFRGKVLDIGGRDRGAFVKPKDRVEQWVHVDIVPDHKPDLVADVADLNTIADASIDVVAAIELFEHVNRIEKGVAECRRVLKPGGVLLISVPFLVPVHADPFDFQRWTRDKWQQQLQDAGFVVAESHVGGYYFTVLGDVLRSGLKALPPILRHLAVVLYPLIDVIVACDRIPAVARSAVLGRYHAGYFFMARVPQENVKKERVLS